MLSFAMSLIKTKIIIQENSFYDSTYDIGIYRRGLINADLINYCS